MDIRELYTSISGDFDGLIERLGSDRLVNTLLKLFADDKNFNELTSSMEAGEYDKAFRAAHGLKGLCANLAIVRLGALSGEITEALRDGSDIDRAKELLPAIKEEYLKVTTAISEYNNG